MLIKNMKQFEHDVKSMMEFKKQINLLKHRMALFGERNIKKSFYNRFNRKSGELANKIGSNIKAHGIEYVVDVDYSSHLNRGILPHAMRYLIGSKRPIPLQRSKLKGFIKGWKDYKWKLRKDKAGRIIGKKMVKNTDKVIFRWVTEKSIQKGHWRHPGVRKDKNLNNGLGFMDEAMRQTRSTVQKEVAKLKRQKGK